MDLEAVARKGEATPVEVCLTVATESKGVPELLENLENLDSVHRDSGEREKRRGQAHVQEVLDWCLEILRPQLHKKIVEKNLPLLGDPRLKAKKILQET
jgi:putative protein kinase ArgK-like GTPase of G3E family